MKKPHFAPLHAAVLNYKEWFVSSLQQVLEMPFCWLLAWEAWQAANENPRITNDKEWVSWTMMMATSRKKRAKSQASDVRKCYISLFQALPSPSFFISRSSMPQDTKKRSSIKPMNFVQESRIRRKKEKEQEVFRHRIFKLADRSSAFFCFRVI